MAPSAVPSICPSPTANSFTAAFPTLSAANSVAIASAEPAFASTKTGCHSPGLPAALYASNSFSGTPNNLRLPPTLSRSSGSAGRSFAQLGSLAAFSPTEDIISPPDETILSPVPAASAPFIPVSPADGLEDGPPTLLIKLGSVPSPYSDLITFPSGPIHSPTVLTKLSDAPFSICRPPSTIPPWASLIPPSEYTALLICMSVISAIAWSIRSRFAIRSATVLLESACGLVGGVDSFAPSLDAATLTSTTAFEASCDCDPMLGRLDGSCVVTAVVGAASLPVCPCASRTGLFAASASLPRSCVAAIGLAAVGLGAEAKSLVLPSSAATLPEEGVGGALVSSIVLPRDGSCVMAEVVGAASLPVCSCASCAGLFAASPALASLPPSCVEAIGLAAIALAAGVSSSVLSSSAATLPGEGVEGALVSSLVLGLDGSCDMAEVAGAASSVCSFASWAGLLAASPALALLPPSCVEAIGLAAIALGIGVRRSLVLSSSAATLPGEGVEGALVSSLILPFPDARPSAPVTAL